jgi:ABC-type branched-subunit amino acid transport system substrate-binding protein
MTNPGLRVAAAFAALIAMLGIAACGGDEDTSGPQKLDVKIGSLIPRTGFLEQFAAAGQQAGDLAVDEIRKAAARAGAQHKVTITHIDDKTLPRTALIAGEKFAKDKSTCIIGPWSNGQVQRVARQVAVPRKIPMITPSASSDIFESDQDRGYLFRTVPPDRLQVDALAELMADKLKGARGKEVNVGALESEYGKDLTEDFKDAWAGKGGRVGKEVMYSSNQATFEQQEAFKKSIDELAKGKPDAWVFFDFQDPYTRVAGDLLSRNIGFSPKKVFAADSLANPRLLTNEATVEGLRGVAISSPDKGASAEEFDRRFKARGSAARQTFDAQEFDAVVLCYLSAVAAGTTKGSKVADKVREVSAPPGRKFTWMQLDVAIKALEAGQDIDYEGASGPIDMNEQGDPAAGVYDVYEFKSDKLDLIDQISVPERPGGI